MKVKELLQKLQRCNPDYEVVLAQTYVLREQDGEVDAVEEAGEDDYFVRLDKPLEQVFIDHNDQEVCMFTAHDDEGNPTNINPETPGIEEILLDGNVEAAAEGQTAEIPHCCQDCGQCGE